MNSLFRKFLVLIALVLLLAAPGCHNSKNQTHGARSDAADIQGSWTGTAQQTGSPNPTFTLKLNKKEDGEVWGTITSRDGTFEEAIISAGKIEEDKVTFSATANGTNFRNGHTYSFEASVQGDRMEGVWKDILERNWGSFAVIREKPQTAEKKS